MQYTHTPAFHDLDRHHLWQKFKYVATALLAGLALYGLGTHHVILVAAGLLAALAFDGRLHSADAKTPDLKPGSLAHSDGGSFPGATPESVQTRRMHPRVLDGGSLEHRIKR
jgi:hypothetical protein